MLKVTVPLYESFEFNGRIISDPRRSWKEQESEKSLPAAIAAEGEQATHQQPIPEHQQQETSATARSSTVALAPSSQQQLADLKAPTTPVASGLGLRSSLGARSDRSESACSERSDRSRQGQDQQLFSVIKHVPYVKNAMLISNVNDDVCWLPLGPGEKTVDDWQITHDPSNQLSSVSFNKKGKVGEGVIVGPIEGGIRSRRTIICSLKVFEGEASELL
jgi:hypothetical protein